LKKLEEVKKKGNGNMSTDGAIDLDNRGGAKR
jgi:hypothetical protein